MISRTNSVCRLLPHSASQVNCSYVREEPHCECAAHRCSVTRSVYDNIMHVVSNPQGATATLNSQVPLLLSMAQATAMRNDSAEDSQKEGVIVGGAVSGRIVLVIFLAISETYLCLRRRRYGTFNRLPVDFSG
ncbi:hypothetical protein C8Q73DRAFT_348722 [Cubamyces lactineus]|nr:hypothetical protein C8Q73DRAFT_348722 [Cubamyces lactineus]